MSNKNRTDLQAGFDATGAIETNTSNLVSAADIVTQLDHISDSSTSRLDDKYIRYTPPSGVSGTNAIALTLTNDYPTSYNADIPIFFRPVNNNTGTPTINVNSIGAVNIYALDNTQITAADFFSTDRGYLVRWDTDADGAGGDGFVIIEMTKSASEVVSGGSSTTSIIPIMMENYNYTATTVSNTQGRVGRVFIPAAITVNTIYFYVPGVTTTGTFNIMMYDVNFNRIINETTASISAQGAYSVTVTGGVTLGQGIYHTAVSGNSTAEATFYCINNNDFQLIDISGEDHYMGIITDANLGATLDPADITHNNTSVPAFRLEN